jgi:hypothetical protein
MDDTTIGSRTTVESSKVTEQTQSIARLSASAGEQSDATSDAVFRACMTHNGLLTVTCVGNVTRRRSFSLLIWHRIPMKHRQLWVINIMMNPLSLLISFALSFPNTSLFVVATL